jgi:hypothetical protein
MEFFPAKQAREFTDKHEYYSSELWYREYKYELFKKIKAEALKGNNQVILSRNDWDANIAKEEYLKSELLEHDYNWLSSEGVIKISW